MGDKMSSIGHFLQMMYLLQKKRSSRQVWNKINETNQGRRISLDPLSRTAMLSVHRGLLALRDTGTVRGERRWKRQSQTRLSLEGQGKGLELQALVVQFNFCLSS